MNAERGVRRFYYWERGDSYEDVEPISLENAQEKVKRAYGSDRFDAVWDLLLEIGEVELSFGCYLYIGDEDA